MNDCFIHRTIPLRVEERFKYFVERVGKARIWDNDDGGLFRRLQEKAALLLDEMALLCDQRFDLKATYPQH